MAGRPQVAIRLPHQLKARIEALAARRGKERDELGRGGAAAVARDAILRGLPLLELEEAQAAEGR